uniref:Uncharacterized protein n=1 Tax=Trichuris muris TaxID=70415 RepID=A0A5S6QEI3_TRIMR
MTLKQCPGTEIGYHFFRVPIMFLDDLVEMTTEHPDIFRYQVRRFPIEESDFVMTAAVGALCMFIGRNLVPETYDAWSRKFMERFMVLLNLRMNSSDVRRLPSTESAMHLNTMFQQSCTM